MHPSVRWSALSRVGAANRTTLRPSGRKIFRSTHSSTAGSLSSKSAGGVTQHLFDAVERLERLLFGDHERRIDAHLGVVDHGQHAARETPVEDLPGDALGQ